MPGWIVVFLGAGVGGLLRWQLGEFVRSQTTGEFPWGTFAVNVLGCFVIGLIWQWTDSREPWRLALVVGLLGGFTTFSTFGRETWQLLDAGRWSLAGAYVVASNVAGIAAVGLGVTIVRLATRP